MLSYFSIFVCTCAFLGFCTKVNSGPWASPALEKLDEVNDIEIYRSIVTSMKAWEERQKAKTNHRRNKRQESSICFKDLGCFEASGPFGYIDMLPGPPEEIATKFLLYPSQRRRRSGFVHAEVPFENLTDAFKWAHKGFNTSLPTKILIHGFGSDCSHVWVYELRSALMAVEEMNIICVDWSKGAELPNYVKASANTRLVGKQLAVLLQGLINKTGLSPRSMHLIGFSLGAHVAGFAGAEIGNLSRITGLDPAGPLFESQDPRARLDQTDANFVDVIHSNGENLILGGLGSWQPLGHVDFYPNGGRMQKGCSNIFVGAVSDIIWSSAVEGRSLCNHRRAYKFFTDSVSPRCHFPAFPCESYEDFLDGNCFPCTSDRNCGNMGYYADRSKGRGQLFLITRDEEPFCAHQYSVKIESSNSDIPITSYGKIQITLVGDSDMNETFLMTRKDDEEMKLGYSISRILVPHPILAEPAKIQILYTAYSGWLSSGLTHWKIDKVILSDSFGKISSVCQKSLILESGKAIILPLYPGECAVPIDDSSNILPKIKPSSIETNFSKFVPTPVIQIGDEIIRKEYIKDKDNVDVYNLPWQPIPDGKDNTVDGEKETSRALNTRFAKHPFDENLGPSTEVLHEIVEPVLRPHSNKIARSHNLDKDKQEISEPILGSTTSRSSSTPIADSLSSSSSKEITYNFYDSNDNNWNHPIDPHTNGEKWKRHDDSKSNAKFEKQDFKTEKENENVNFITMTVQFLPHRIAKMLEQAEKYARETILPFVSAHTPKIIRDFITPEETPKYLPLNFEEPIEDHSKSSFISKENEIKSDDQHLSTYRENYSSSSEEDTLSVSTPYSNIQKISKRGQLTSEITTNIAHEDNEAAASEHQLHKLEASKEFVSRSFPISPILNTTKDIYINLPVFAETSKYIPLTKDNSGSEKPR